MRRRTLDRGGCGFVWQLSKFGLWVTMRRRRFGGMLRQACEGNLDRQCSTKSRCVLLNNAATAHSSIQAHHFQFLPLNVFLRDLAHELSCASPISQGDVCIVSLLVDRDDSICEASGPGCGGKIIAGVPQWAAWSRIIELVPCPPETTARRAPGLLRTTTKVNANEVERVTKTHAGSSHGVNPFPPTLVPK